ncbi:type II toxin-antitoxin system RelB/DinJ family antitoxin [Vagococcus fluvialis]|uniref:type II toxin-antitoxin system RelB/DinJ family antitoxin n=1 Tax=Vagococcus fluvialis TaxID=2738 RepID=UPI002B29EBE4|nr:type II toxin-antitoxin system RelB/DinJ family antitoxin [Vagococcus fluvialis]
MDKNQVKKNIEIEVDSSVFEQAEYIANKLGLTVGEITASMVTRIVALKGIPFALSLTEEEKEEISSKSNQ